MANDRNLEALLEQQCEMFAMLQNMYTSLQNTNTSLQNTNTSLQALVEQKDAEIERLNEIIRNFQKVLFGRKSEKSEVVIPGQFKLFDDPVPSEVHPEPAKEQVVAAHTRRKKRTQEEIYAALPVEKKIIDIPDEQKIAPDGYKLDCIGLEYCGFEVVHIPSRVFRLETYRKVYADRRNEAETGESIIVKPDAPKPLIEHSFASASLVVLIIQNKYFCGLPLYRQEQLFKQKKFPLGRATMANWVITVAQLYLSRLYLRFKELLLKQSVIHADETPLKVLKEPGRTADQKSYIWAYVSSKRAEIQIRCFEYQPSRAATGPEEFLKDFHGIIVSDGYVVYGMLKDIINAGCWAHMRRKWIDAMPKKVPTEKCAQTIGIEFCNRLFELERKFEAYSDEERQKKRNEPYDPSKPEEKSSAVIMQEYWEWIESLGATGGELKKAVTYALNQKPYLETCLKHGEIEISNNQVENAIRPIVVGRKNWLFSDTAEGAHASAIIYSVIETAKANNLNVEAWLTYILETMPNRFARDPNANIDDLLPWAAEMKRFELK